MDDSLPLAASSWDDEEVKALEEVIKSGQYSMGSEVAEFESQFAQYHDMSQAVMVNSGSSANLLMLSGLKYGPRRFLEAGDEVIAPAVSWSTTYYPINQVGARIRLVDVDPETLNMSVDAVTAAITPKTKAILAVNLLGNPAPLPELLDLSQATGIPLLEDNCESLGASVGGKMTGAFGHMSSQSFFFSHHMSTMEGGAVLTDDPDLAIHLKSLRAHGWTRDMKPTETLRGNASSRWAERFDFVLPGYNLRPLEMSGAVGKVQLRKLGSFVEARRGNAKHWQEVTNGLSGIRIQKENGASSWFGFSIVLEDHLRDRREELVDQLSRAGIESRPVVAGNIMRHAVVKHLDIVGDRSFPVADEIHDQGLFIGNHHFPVEDALDQVVDVISNM